MKRFIIISLLSALTLPMMACLWWEPDNPYLFSMYRSNNFRTRVEKICNDNWKAYLGSTDEWYYFDADEIIKAAQQKGDALMVSYIQNLKKYLDCVDIEQRKQYEWNYPTKEELSGLRNTLMTIRSYALGKTKTKLRSQHALLYMRCNMMLGRHQDNITFWEQTASQYIETVYKDMMKNIYAGALYNSNREAEAGELFAEMDDYESLMTQFYKKRSYLAISQHYKQSPNSKVLPFLLQDFVNNAQEAEDAKGNGALGGKLFIRDINQQESWQMQQFCELVVREGKTETPIMWKCAKAWLEYLSGKKQEALKDIEAAMKLEGTERMKDNARVLKFYISAAQAKPSDKFDQYVTEEIEWLWTKSEEDEFYKNAMRRLSNQVIIPHYQDKPEQQLALMLTTGNYLYSNHIDTMRVDRLEKFYYYTLTPGKKPFDKFLKCHISTKDSTLIELIGTKYMRLAQWDKAIQWLKDIPASYYNKNSSEEYLYYAYMRNWEVEPWIHRQWLDSGKAYERKWTWNRNIKLDFCKEMQMMESSLHLLKDRTLERRYYNLAVRYAQAAIKGDCWWLLRDAKSCYDTVRVNEVDFAAKAVELLQKTAMTSDPDLKLKALFGMGYRELYGSNTKLWKETEWSEKVSDYVTQYYAQAPQFRAYQALFDLVEDEPEEPMYISKCDEFLQFRKYYRQHR